jgi:hypothetical protein
MIFSLLQYCCESFAQPSSSPALPEFVDQQTQQAIQQSLDWLAHQQDSVTGAYGQGTEWQGNVGVTALAGMAFLSSGSTPTAGPYQRQLERITEYLLICSTSNGFIKDTSRNQGPMYGHGFATMYLAEVYGMSRQPALRAKLRMAVDLILNTQNDEGGWRYLPEAQEADVSVTVCQMMALRAARNAGLAVPKGAIEQAVSYLERCQNAEGGFRYRLHDAAESRLPRSAAALVGLYSAGIADGPAVDAGILYMERYIPGPRTARDSQYYYYGAYYSGQAAWQAGGETWARWYPAQRAELLRLRTPEGHWSDPWIGNDYATAMALIALQLPFNNVPLFDR